MKLGTSAHRGLKAALTATASAAILALATSGANALPGRDDISPGGNVDTSNVWAGVGMMYAEPGYVCTGQLINARTVIFAAHCADTVANAGYGAEWGGLGMAFNFSVNALPGFQDWLSNSYASNPSLGVYNVMQIQTVNDGTFQFPGGDVAMATLDTPAIGLPTYGMLFSPLTESMPVNMVGYGRTGNGSSGDYYGIDWQRRAGTNMLDGLFSQDDFLAATFAVASGLWSGNGFYPESDQMLYHIDFDRPGRNANDCARGTVFIGPNDYTCTTGPFTSPITLDGTSAFMGGDHINWFGGDATDQESGTAGGDSGSGLFVEMDGQQLVTGVLSGGWTFTSPNGGYGDLSYYNPLFLYQNWIVAFNPMVYASAVEGNGNWSDAAHWQQDLDPNYMILDSEGNLVNGLEAGAPNSYLEAAYSTDGRWGTILDTNLDDLPHYSTVAPQEPLGQGGSNANSGIARDNLGSAGINADNNLGTASIAATDKAASVQIQNTLGGSSSSTGGSAAAAAGPGGTFTLYGDDGLLSLPPLGWVPNNDYGTFGSFAGPASGTAHFYDVLLGESGTTTVDMDVEIDNFTIANTGARLFVDAPYTFNSLISFNQLLGNVTIDGRVNAREYVLTSGILDGSGELNTITLWNLAGGVAPGGLGTVDTFTLMGDYVQTAAGSLWVDFGTAGGDLLDIDGDFSLDGALIVTPTSGYIPQWGDSFTAVQGTGSRVGKFAAVSDLPGVLRPYVVYTSDAAIVELRADTFGSQAAFTNDFQGRLGIALDQGRAGSYGDLEALYTFIDLLEGDDLANAFNTISPVDSIMADRGVRTNIETLNRALRNHISDFDGAAGLGSDRSILAEVKASEGLGEQGGIGMMALNGVKNHHEAGEGQRFRTFGSIGSISGSNMVIDDTMTADLDGTYGIIGFDAAFGDNLRVGFAAGMADSDNEGRGILNATNSSVSSEQIGVFASFQRGRIHASGSLAFTSHDINSIRTLNLGGATSGVTADYSADGTVFDAMVAYDLTPDNEMLRIAPFFGITSSEIDFDSYTGLGPVGALTVEGRSYSSLITRWGSMLDLDFGQNEFELYAAIASETNGDDDTYVASFAAAPTVAFQGTTALDLEDWAELGASFSRELEMGATVSLSGEVISGNDAMDANTIAVELSLPF